MFYSICRLLKQQRRAQQEKNVERKKSEASKENEAKGDENDQRAEDLEWYRQEVGEEPDESK